MQRMRQIGLKSTALIISLFSIITLSAQSIRDVRINEIQVHNTDGFRDEYGHLGGWIELFNTGYGKVNIAGATFKINGAEYRLPKGSPIIIPTRGYLLFYAGGTPNKGLFHTNFTLKDTDFIAFYDADGKLIDRLDFNPADMIENVSFGWFVNANGKESLINLSATTPGSDNNTEEKIPKAEIFRQADPNGIILTIISVLVVTIALTVLFFIFKSMGDFHVKRAKRKAESGRTLLHTTGKNEERMVTNDELAAIAIALFKYSEELHDIEDAVLTINRVAKIYSPWNSKIYNMNQLPSKR